MKKIFVGWAAFLGASVFLIMPFVAVGASPLANDLNNSNVSVSTSILAELGSILSKLIVLLGKFSQPTLAQLSNTTSLSLITDPNLVFSEPQVPRPAYLVPITDPVFGTKITRIANDTGQSLTTLNTGNGVWSSDARHHYSTRQPWNADGTLYYMENRSAGGGSPSRLFLDGETFAVKYGSTNNTPSGDPQWHPNLAHANEMVIAPWPGTILRWYNVVTSVVTRSWTLPITVTGGMALGGNLSSDGRFVVLGDNDGTASSNNARLFVVDMDPQPPYALYPAPRFGPLYDLKADGQWPQQVGVYIGHASVSSSGKYVLVKYGGGALDNYVRVFDIDPVTLALSPRPLPAATPHCSASIGASPQQGFIWSLKHPDMALDPFQNNEDVIIGGNGCSNTVGTVVPGIQLATGATGVGRIIKVQLSNGVTQSLTNPTNEAYMNHVSARNVDRPGWVYVNYDLSSGKRFDDEVIALKIDGSQSVERLAHTHTNDSGVYRAEPHSVPSPDGKRIVFTSNWTLNCDAGCGPLTTDVKDYLVDTRGSVPPPPPPDTTPPVISSVQASGVSDTTATITWTTDEAAGSQVEYGTTTSYGQTSTYNASLITSHSVALSSLVPSTSYHYRVISLDVAGNKTTSSDFTFITTAPPATAPSIITQPSNQTVTVGSTATFNVVAAGTPPLSYQWQKNGSNIVGATSASYTTLATMVSDSGSTYRVIVSNSAGSMTSTNATLTVNAPVVSTFDFSLTNGGSKLVVVGQTVTNTVTASLISGSTQTVTLAAAGLPAGATASFLPTACNPLCSSTLTIATTAATPAGSYLITVSGTGGDLTRTTSFNLTVGNAVVTPPFDFSVVNNGDHWVQQGSTAKNKITVNLTSGTTQAVTLSVSGLPSQATASFSASTCSPSCTSTLTISTNSATPTGAYLISVIGSSGGVTHTTSFLLTVVPPCPVTTTAFTPGRGVFAMTDLNVRTSGGSIAGPPQEQGAGGLTEVSTYKKGKDTYQKINYYQGTDGYSAVKYLCPTT